MADLLEADVVHLLCSIQGGVTKYDVTGIGVDLTGILGGRMAVLTIKVLL